MMKSVSGVDSSKQPNAWAVGRRSWLSASQRVLRAAEGAVNDALLELEQHVAGPRRGAQATRRMHEVVTRDRDAASAAERRAAAAPPPAQAEAARTPEPPRTGAAGRPASPPDDEPIQTRTYARLLAAQGETQRALTMYVRLMEKDPRDVGLAVEASELRRSLELDQPF